MTAYTYAHLIVSDMMEKITVWVDVDGVLYGLHSFASCWYEKPPTHIIACTDDDMMNIAFFFFKYVLTEIRMKHVIFYSPLRYHFSEKTFKHFKNCRRCSS